MMFQEKRLAALGTSVRSFLWRASLTSHVLLLFHLGLDLRGVDVGENMSKMSGAVRLAGRHIVRCGGLIRGSSRSLHQDFVAFLCSELKRSKWCHEVLAHGVLVGCCED